MRQDFNKLLVERERIGSKRCFGDTRNSRKMNEDHVLQIGGHEGMRRRHKISVTDKSFNENLNPLKGFLRSKLGKNWDKTYSELRKTFDARSVINGHILQHLWQYVERNAVVIEGKVMVLNVGYYSNDYVPIEKSYSDYYVCPKDGTLKKTRKQSLRSVKKDREEARLEEEAKFFRALDDKTHLRFIDGLWYAFDVKELPIARIEYHKPAFENKFYIDGYGATAKYAAWEELNEAQRRTHGVKKAIDGVVFDEYTKREVFRENYVKRYRSSGPYYSYGPKEIGQTQYYVNKRTASYKMLKLLNLLGSASFDETKTMSHREVSKYRQAA